MYAYTTDNASEDGSDYDSDYRRRDQGLEHPCQSLKKLLSDGTFYYSSDFDVTSRVQDRFVKLANTFNLALKFIQNFRLTKDRA